MPPGTLSFANDNQGLGVPYAKPTSGAGEVASRGRALQLTATSKQRDQGSEILILQIKISDPLIRLDPAYAHFRSCFDSGSERIRLPVTA